MLPGDLAPFALVGDLEPASVDVLGRIRQVRLERRDLDAAVERVRAAGPEVTAAWAG